MNRRIVWLGVWIGCAGMMLAGCEAHHRLGVARAKPEQQPAEAEPPVVVYDGGGDDEAKAKAPAGPRGFFKPTRLPGALSSEAADIERSLGVE